MATIPTTKYAISDGVYIAYQVHGRGAVDLVTVPPAVSHLDLRWDDPAYARALRRLGSFARVIALDKRGSGLSDRTAKLPSAEEQVADIAAVMDAAGSERAFLFGGVDGGAASLLFAATQPARARGVVAYAVPPAVLKTPDYPWGIDPAALEMLLEAAERDWGGPTLASLLAPSASGDPAFAQWFGRFFRSAVSPGAAVTWLRDLAKLDIRHALPTVPVPTLVLQRKDDPLFRVEAGRYLSERLPDAKYVEVPGRDHLYWVGDAEPMLDEIREFVTGTRVDPDPDRVLATVLFTDMVGSTELATSLGDRRWRDLLEAHNDVVRKELSLYGGREVDTAGDGFFAVFDGPARAIRCAQSIAERVRGIGAEIRAGVHTGEVELRGDKVQGVSVHIGARIAGPGGTERSARIRHGPGSRGRFGALVRRSRRARAEGSAGPVAALGGRDVSRGIQRGARRPARGSYETRCPAGLLSDERARE